MTSDDLIRRVNVGAVVPSTGNRLLSAGQQRQVGTIRDLIVKAVTEGRELSEAGVIGTFTEDGLKIKVPWTALEHIGARVPSGVAFLLASCDPKMARLHALVNEIIASGTPPEEVIELLEQFLLQKEKGQVETLFAELVAQLSVKVTDSIGKRRASTELPEETVKRIVLADLNDIAYQVVNEYTAFIDGQEGLDPGTTIQMLETHYDGREKLIAEVIRVFNRSFK